jgi:LysR family transcriptional regulator for metE and metH
VVTSDPVTLPGISYVPVQLRGAAGHRQPPRHAPQAVPGARRYRQPDPITYPIERTRLDIFTRFLDPADVEPAQVRTSELTVMMMQLVASGRGVCCLPNWAVHEYSSRGYVTAKRLGEHGLQANSCGTAQ